MKKLDLDTNGLSLYVKCKKIYLQRRLSGLVNNENVHCNYKNRNVWRKY